MFDAYLSEIAAAYDALPEGLYSSPTETVAGARDWAELANDSVHRARGVRLLLDVIETDESEPYPDAVAMCEDIAGGRFLVSRANSEHPIWSEAENVAFRIVHDVLGHYAASVAEGFDAEALELGGEYGGDSVEDTARYEEARDAVAGFDWEGENLACAAHLPLLPTIGARRALFTECIAQTGFAIDRGGFGPQKVGDLTSAMTIGPVDLAVRYREYWLKGEVIA